MHFDKVVLQNKEPQTDVLWAKPDKDKIGLFIYNNGKWVPLSSASADNESDDSSSNSGSIDDEKTTVIFTENFNYGEFINNIKNLTQQQQDVLNNYVFISNDGKKSKEVNSYYNLEHTFCIGILWEDGSITVINEINEGTVDSYPWYKRYQIENNAYMFAQDGHGIYDLVNGWEQRLWDVIDKTNVLYCYGEYKRILYLQSIWNESIESSETLNSVWVSIDPENSNVVATISQDNVNYNYQMNIQNFE